MPTTRPEQVFGNDGICDACVSVKKKFDGSIDWDERKSQFESILAKYRSDGSKYDCIIPISGGKDSCSQALIMRDEFGMHPLCVNFLPCELTETGWKNLLFLRDQGFDIIHIGSNRHSYREMMRIGFNKLGDCCWPEHIGIFTAPVRVAVNYKIPLLIWGENSQLEYGGPLLAKQNHFLDRNWLEQYQMLGYRISDLAQDGIDLNDIRTFHYPTDEEIHQVGVTGLFLGFFRRWDSKENADRVLQLGWHRNPGGPVEGAYNDLENLDCKWIGGLHDYMKYIKYGYGRATDQLCIEVRSGRLSREEAIAALKTTSEGKMPWKYIPDFLSHLSISQDQFIKTLDRFTNRRIFETDSKGNLIKNDDGSPKRKFWPQ